MTLLALGCLLQQEAGRLLDFSPTTTKFLILSSILFIIGVGGVLARRNIIVIFMSIELILNAVNINFIAFARH
jgi:NADH:ubiquinone oxidoreductase subunit K